VHEALLEYPAVFQNFEKTIFNNLTKASHLIEKYNKLILLFSKEKQPKGILTGFKMFCKNKSIPFEVLYSTKEGLLEKGELYIIPDDKNLLRIIKKIKSQRFTLAQDIGVISYNDTLLKEIVEDGITTITTDFNEMGKTLAKMILNKEQVKIENPNKLIIRNSI